ncbi:uncharacterized protein LOC106462808 [Limulus polyphemus]|uniref:Uncharacterized protein LOC106462808 n=1 Tax=Limulus polyphemus TaxID=6850 RepID=A0ABM1BAP4_LIMPO|nr:uncharacterized protein LOC106462808 [Limulus polyphemus]
MNNSSDTFSGHAENRPIEDSKPQIFARNHQILLEPPNSSFSSTNLPENFNSNEILRDEENQTIESIHVGGRIENVVESSTHHSMRTTSPPFLSGVRHIVTELSSEPLHQAQFRFGLNSSGEFSILREMRYPILPLEGAFGCNSEVTDLVHPINVNVPSVQQPGINQQNSLSLDSVQQLYDATSTSIHSLDLIQQLCDPAPTSTHSMYNVSVPSVQQPGINRQKNLNLDPIRQLCDPAPTSTHRKYNVSVPSVQQPGINQQNNLSLDLIQQFCDPAPTSTHRKYNVSVPPVQQPGINRENSLSLDPIQQLYDPAPTSTHRLYNVNVPSVQQPGINRENSLSLDLIQQLCDPAPTSTHRMYNVNVPSVQQPGINRENNLSLDLIQQLCDPAPTSTHRMYNISVPSVQQPGINRENILSLDSIQQLCDPASTSTHRMYNDSVPSVQQPGINRENILSLDSIQQLCDPAPTSTHRMYNDSVPSVQQPGINRENILSLDSIQQLCEESPFSPHFQGSVDVGQTVLNNRCSRTSGLHEIREMLNTPEKLQTVRILQKQYISQIMRSNGDKQVLFDIDAQGSLLHKAIKQRQLENIYVLMKLWKQAKPYEACFTQLNIMDHKGKGSLLSTVQSILMANLSRKLRANNRFLTVGKQ